MKYVSKDQNDPHRYDDLLNMERPLSQHKALSMAQRAAQFASFDALDGYKDTIQENGRITVEQIELSDDEKQIIDTKLQALKENISTHPCVTITYFVQDYLKDGGMYETLISVDTLPKYYEDIVKDELNVKKIEFGGVELESGTVIAIQDIIQIDV